MYYFTNYRGVRGTTMFEAQFSQRKFKFADDGGTSTNIVDSPFFSLSCACLYNAPYFDATDPENRNNQQITGNMTKFWNGAGRHETKVGYEFFRSQRTGGNSQSSTSYVFNADFEMRGGLPIPHFVPGETYVENYVATRGATMNINNHSAFIQDRWAISDRLSANLGLRFEQVKVESTGEIISVNTSPRIVPRLGLSYDLRGDGANVIHATYGQYSGRYSEAQVGGNSPVGSPATLSRYYTGPECIGDETACAAGFNLANYPITAAEPRARGSAAGQHLRRPEAEDAADARIHGVVRPHARWRQRLRRGQLHLPPHRQHGRGLHHHRRRHDARGVQRRRRRHGEQRRLPQHR